MIAWYEAAFPDAARRSGAEATRFSQPRRHAAIRCSGRDVLVSIADEREAAHQLVRRGAG
jgi:hypothetical protein